jgi:hypothetical protein
MVKLSADLSVVLLACACYTSSGELASGGRARLTSAEARECAKYEGMKEAKGKLPSQNRLVFEKDGRFFAPSPVGYTAAEVWTEFGLGGGRIATCDINLNQIGP